MSPTPDTSTLPADLVANPRLSRWIKVGTPGVIELFVGKVELGQGIGITLRQIAADELEVPLAALRVVAGATDLCPDQGLTAGSLSVEVGGMALRAVCAEVRQLFTEQAARHLNASAAEVVVKAGRFQREAKPERGVTYWDLAAEVDLERDATGGVVQKPWQARHLSGRSEPRPDLTKKLFGAAYLHDLELPGMWHARIVRPPSYGARLLEFDSAAVRAMPGIEHVLVDGRFIGICAQREEQAIAAAERVVRGLARWEERAELPEPDPTQAWLPALPAETSVIERSEGVTAPVTRQLECNYSRPFLAHASIGPSCALAHWHDEHLTVWSHTQGSFSLRRELAAVLELALEQVSVIHQDGAGCYGHNGADDAALDAALLARACGRPVRVQWSREDELAWSPFGSAMVVRIAAGLDAAGRIASWHHDTWSHTHVQRPGTGNGAALIAAWHRDPPAALPQIRDFPLAKGGGGPRNAQPLYVLPSREIVYHLAQSRTLRTSALRTLGAFANVFAIESCFDELALLAGADPIAFRLAHLEDARAREVLETVARASDWYRPKAPARRAGALRGRGVGFARYKNTGAYCAVVIEIEVTDRIVLERVTVALDAGEVVNPDGLRNQIEGGVLQAASWTLKEAVQWDRTRVTSRSWDDYPILRFDEVPGVFSIELVPHPELPPLGVGECTAGPTAAALANALAEATEVRVRDLPLTPARLLAAFEAA